MARHCNLPSLSFETIPGRTSISWLTYVNKTKQMVLVFLIFINLCMKAVLVFIQSRAPVTFTYTTSFLEPKETGTVSLTLRAQSYPVF